MKNPHEQSEYVKMDDAEQAEPQDTETQPPVEPTEAPVAPTKKPKKSKYSGAYYYVDTDEQQLSLMSFARTSLTIIAFLLQMAVLLFPQAGTEYVSDHIASYGLIYVLFTIFGMVGVSIWLMVMNQVRYKFAKRIVAEHAPRHGFKNRAYFGLELHMAVIAVMAAFELSFVCIKFDGWGLGGLFMCLASLAAAVAARQICHLTLKDAELVPAPTQEQ